VNSCQSGKVKHSTGPDAHFESRTATPADPAATSTHIDWAPLL